ncbi:MAG: T9SS type A sorting domain-containing protein [Lewinellaceae bacterium]|nr:T9SS type A sorting domain-containing protein [Lewinellaceae bacterium]
MSVSYILESAFCMACLYAFYWLALQRETFFQWNRIYLLLSPLIALSLPALHISLETPAATPDIPQTPALEFSALVEQAQAAPAHFRHTLAQPVAEGWSVSLGTLLWWAYLLGAGLLTLRLLLRIVLLWRTIGRYRKGDLSGFEEAPASFFGLIFWKNKPGQAAASSLILEHEHVHVRQWHSLDVLLMEAMLIVQWFNPLMHAFRRSLCAVHEYIADAHVVRDTGRRSEYATLLVQHQKAGQRARSGLVNTFHSLIKHRLLMLARRPSRPFRRLKYLLIMPLFATLMLLFSFRLVETLPAAAPLAEAMRKADLLAGMLGEVTVAAEKPAPASEPTPYIFYWGSVQCRIVHDPATGEWYGGVDLSPEEFREALKREPRLYNGQSLEQRFSLQLGNIAVNSDYYDESIYKTVRPEVEAYVAGLDKNDYLQLKNLPLPNGEKAVVYLSFGAVAPGWLPRNSSQINWAEDPAKIALMEPTVLIWGDARKSDADRQFFTVEEFWQHMQQTPKIVHADGTEGIADKLVVWVAKPGVFYEMIVAIPAELEGIPIAGIRAKLESVKTRLQPGVMVRIAQLGNDDQSALFSSSGAQSVFSLVPEGDPRLHLKRDERRDFYFEWGNLGRKFPMMYARSFGQGDAYIHADQPYRAEEYSMTAGEIIQMTELAPRLFREKQEVTHFSFRVDYAGRSAVAENGHLPEAFRRWMAERLGDHDLLQISGFRAGEIDLSNVTISLDVKPNDPKPPLQTGAVSPLVFSWGDFTQHMSNDFSRQRSYRSGDGDTISYYTLSTTQLKNMLARPPQMLENGQTLSGLRFYISCGSLGEYVTEKGLSGEQVEAFRKSICHGSRLTITGFKGSGLDLRGLVLSFFPYDDENPPEGASQDKVVPYQLPTKLYLSVSPNPATSGDMIAFSYDLPKEGNVTLLIVNAAGQTLYSRTEMRNQGTYVERISAQQLKLKGSFVATLETPYGKVSKQFVVQ